MKGKIINIFLLLIQCIAAFVVMICIYMAFVLLDYTGGFAALVGTIILQPILGSILVFITMLICLIAGLPLRLSKPIKQWWLKHQKIPIILIFISSVSGIISFLPSFTDFVLIEENGRMIYKEIPNSFLIILTWFLLCFSLLHFYPWLLIKKNE